MLKMIPFISIRDWSQTVSMAENSYKKTSESKGKPIFKFTFLKDRKFHLFVGFSLVFVSIFLMLSFTSYLSHGLADQSVVEAFLETSIKESGQEVRNSLGLFGAISSHYFIFLWFGIAALLIPPFLFITGYRIVRLKTIIPVNKAFNFTAFYLIWVSLTMGYFLINEEGVTFLGFLAGGSGLSWQSLQKA